MFFSRDSLLIGYIIMINIITFIPFGADKQRAIRRSMRIKVSSLFSLTALGGSLGSWIAMYVFRHKKTGWIQPVFYVYKIVQI